MLNRDALGFRKAETSTSRVKMDRIPLPCSGSDPCQQLSEWERKACETAHRGSPGTGQRRERDLARAGSQREQICSSEASAQNEDEFGGALHQANKIT